MQPLTSLIHIPISLCVIYILPYYFISHTLTTHTLITSPLTYSNPCHFIDLLYTPSRVNNKEGKRVSNALYTVQDVFGKSRARNSKIDQSERSIQMVRCGRGLECKLTRARFRPKERADHNIKQAFMKNLA